MDGSRSRASPPTCARAATSSARTRTRSRSCCATTAPTTSIRDGAASLGLGLVRVEQRRHRLEDLFRDDAAEEAGTCLSRRPPAASTTSATATTRASASGGGARSLTLYVHGLRSAFGLGRRTSSKIFPFALAIFAFVPAIIQLGVGAIVSGVDEHVELFKHEDYFSYVRIILVLFCAAVAPEIVGRDQRNRTLSLYFSRAVTRFDYALAKLAALTSAMLVLTLGPQLLLFLGNGMAADDLSGYIADNWDLVFPIVAGSVLLSADDRLDRARDRRLPPPARLLDRGHRRVLHPHALGRAHPRGDRRHRGRAVGRCSRARSRGRV